MSSEDGSICQGWARRPKIVDFSTHLSGPMAGHLLAEFGCDVVKIERPGVGDGNRGNPPFIEGRGMFHAMLSSGTRSLVVDAHSPYWSDVVREAAKWADGVIVGTTPAAARKRGIDFLSIREHNPQVVYCLISGFGEHGPWADYTAHGQTIDALAGLVPVTWNDGMPETAPGFRTAGATLAGAFGAMGVLVGLLRGMQTGSCQHVSLSLWGSAMWWNWRDVTCQANLGQPWMDYQHLGSRYRIYPTADDRAMLFAPVEERFWVQFCDLIGLPEDWKTRGDWSASGMYYGMPEEAAEIAARIRTRTLEDWWRRAEATDIPFAPVLTVQEALQSEHAGSEAVMRDIDVVGKTVQVPRNPVLVTSDDSPGSPFQIVTLSAPEIGEHTSEVLGEFGLSGLREDIARTERAE
jgi:alpha-methylacyl-CoA racemase